MLKNELMTLVNTLSLSERKYFKKQCAAKSMCNSDYNILFDIMLTTSSVSDAEINFSNKFPNKKFDNTVRYLFDVLIDMLVKFRIENDRWFQRHYGFMKARLCFERSLLTMGHRELRRSTDQALSDQDYFAYYHGLRMGLDHVSNTGFRDLAEDELVDLQMKGRQSLQTLKQIHEHKSLYESLRYRLTSASIKRPHKDVNDLILSEVNIISKGSKTTFESSKLHLLFQSFFFIHTNKYHSALKVFKTLNGLFEQNEHKWDSPPYDYLFSLDGILDCLRSIKYFGEMDYFIDRVRILATKRYPEHFTSVALSTIALYQMNIFIGQNDCKGAWDYLKKEKGNNAIGLRANNYDKGMELLLFVALTYFISNDFRNANRYISRALEIGNEKTGSIVYRVCRLLHIIIHAEIGNAEYLGHEIRSYKRQFKKHGKLLKIERLIFKVVSLDYKRLSKITKHVEWCKIKSKVEMVANDPKDSELFKYYNFTVWIKDALSDLR